MIDRGGNQTTLGQGAGLHGAGARLQCGSTGVASVASRGRPGSTAFGAALLACTLVLLLTGCMQTREPPSSNLANLETAFYELPFTQQRPTGIQPGRYTVSVDVIYTATQEEATQRCNFGLPGGRSLACYLEAGNIIIAPVPRDSNDWQSMCYLGHEMTHGTHGAWHP